MAKPSKWFKKLFHRRHHRKTIPTNNSPTVSTATSNGDYCEADSNKHAIVVAAATAAVAEAALAAARAAVEVVRLTSTGPPPSGHISRRWSLEDFAAVKIQSTFRGCLARKALKALKGLVKLQALVRGHFVRKQSADMLRRLQAMVRVQARARSNRVLNIESSLCSPGNDNPRSREIYASGEMLENSPVLKRCGSNSSIRDCKGSEIAASNANWLDNWVEVGSSISNSNIAKTPLTDDEKNAKILEIDSWKPNPKPKSRKHNNHQPSRHISVQDYYNHSFAASDYLSKYSPNHLHKPNIGHFVEDNASLYTTIESSSPQAFSGASRTGSMRKSPKTPSRDECSRSYLNGFATFASPSYMANTQSSRARSRSRSRSISVPRQRGGDDPEKLGSIKRSLHAFWESKTSSKTSLELSSNLSKQKC